MHRRTVRLGENEIAALICCTEAASMGFSGDILRVPTGEGTVSAQNHLELPVDEEGLTALILSGVYADFTPAA